jgi:hypothetical protein
MLAASRADLSKAFCSYCGYPPMGPWRLRAHQVCMRCEMGMALRALPNEQPRFDEPFLIVDERLIVQAISHRAELLLMVNEPDGFGVPLEELAPTSRPVDPGRAQARHPTVIERASTRRGKAPAPGLRRRGRRGVMADSASLGSSGSGASPRR